MDDEDEPVDVNKFPLGGDNLRELIRVGGPTS